MARFKPSRCRSACVANRTTRVIALAGALGWELDRVRYSTWSVYLTLGRAWQEVTVRVSNHAPRAGFSRQGIDASRIAYSKLRELLE